MTDHLLELTDDPFEREMLLDADPTLLDPDDPMYAELANISTHVSNLMQLLPTKQRLTVPYLATLSNVDIADKLGITPVTVAKARKDPSVRRIQGLMKRLDTLRDGPTHAQRLYMLWDIAKRERINNPNTAIKAIDVINKQTQTYAPDIGGAGGVVVNIQEFQVLQQAQAKPKPEKLVHQPIEGEFTPLQVEIAPDA